MKKYLSTICLCLVILLPFEVYGEGAVGYKDFKIGMTGDELNKLQVCAFPIEYVGMDMPCYNDWLFKFWFENLNLLNEIDGSEKLIGLDITTGPFVQESHDKFKKALSGKYKHEFGITDAELKLFNSSQQDWLFDVFEGGKVSLKIERLADSQNIVTKIIYKDDNNAKNLFDWFAKSRKDLKSDDF